MNIIWRHEAIKIALLIWAGLIFLSVTACSRTDGPNVAGTRTESDFRLIDWLCLYTPGACQDEARIKINRASGDEKFEVIINGKHLRIPMNYIDPEIMAGVTKNPQPDSKVFLKALLPGLAPRTSKNVKDFSYPNSYNVVRFSLSTNGHPTSGKMEWEEKMQLVVARNKNMADRPVRRQDKYGLEIWGEDFDRYPYRAPCKYPKEKGVACGDLTTKDSYRPIKRNGPSSAIACDPIMQIDIATNIMALDESERITFQRKINSDPDRPPYPQCVHDMLYEPLDVWIVLYYRAGMLSQWKNTEDGIRALLDSFIVR